MSLRAAYVVFPSNLWKEYTYLCPFEQAKVGDYALVNNSRVKIVRLTRHIPELATKSLTAMVEVVPSERKREIVERLEAIERLESLAARFAALKSPEAKKLVAEYKRLCK